MDDRLESALEHGRFRESFVRQRRNLEYKMADALILVFNGGTFAATEPRLAALDLMLRTYSEPGETLSLPVLDDYNVPIMIEDVPAFLKALLDVRYRAVNSYFSSYNALRTARTVKAHVGL